MSVTRGLGKNLSALLNTPRNLNEGSISLSPSLSGINKLSLTLLKPGKYQPRRIIEEAPLQELANSIKKQGLLQPIVVRKITESYPAHYEIIAGERRYRASLLAGLTEVPVIVREVDDETAMALALVENLQREDLNPMDHARAIARLVDEFSLTHQEIAQLLSKSRAAVSNFLRLLSLSPQVVALIEQGKLDMGHARALVTLDGAQQIEAAEQIIHKELSVRATEVLVKRLKEQHNNVDEKDNKAFSSPKPCSQFLQKKILSLQEQLHTKIQLKEGKAGKGMILIHYDSEKTLENLLCELGRDLDKFL